MLIDKLVNQHDMMVEKASEAVDEWNKIVNNQVTDGGSCCTGFL